MEAVAAEIGVPIEWVDAKNAIEFRKLRLAGVTDVTPAVARRPAFENTHVYSSQISAETLQLVVLHDNLHAIDNTSWAGLRVGIIPPVIGSDDARLNEASIVEFRSREEAFFGLIAEDVDGLLVPATGIYELAVKAGLDGRIDFHSWPVSEVTRHIAVRKSSAHLLPAINEAIDRMEADGSLPLLRQRYGITVPAPPPEVLTVGVANFPPYKVLGEDGVASGYFVEVFEGIAERAGIDYTFKAITLEDYLRGPNMAGVDVLPALPWTEVVAEVSDFSTLVHREAVGIAISTNDDRTFADLADLMDLRVAVPARSSPAASLEELGLDKIVPFGSGAEMFEALEAGQVDAIVAPTAALRANLELRGLENLFRVSELPTLTIDAAVGLRPGLGEVRDQLNAVIPSYLLSDEYRDLREKYFGRSVFWTEERLNQLFFVGLGGFLLGVGAIGGLWLRSRALKAARNEIRTIFDTATSGIIGLDERGRVVRINAQARKLLRLAGTVPFVYSNTNRFLDVENLKVLDAHADPILRALSGHDLNAEVYLLDPGGGQEERTYIRVSSARTSEAMDNVATVVVLDDVSNEERNRQVVERRSRLDALGQLTGGIAHDFNNLLASQLMAVEAAAETSDDATRAEMLKMTTESIIRGRNLTTRLLSFARKQPGFASSKNTAKLLQEFELLVRPLIESSLTLEFEDVDEDLFQFCDPSQLETALMNCVLNSRDAILRGGKGSTITLSARSVHCAGADDDGIWPPSSATTTRCIEFAVTDDGPGMDAETLARCTDPFFTTKGKNSGTGLGLAMVFGFARQSEGDLRIYSEEGVGTTIHILIPRGTDDGKREQPVTIAQVPRGNGETILAVEDEPVLLQLLTTVLEDLSYNVISSTNGDDALELIRSGTPFDLLLTDVIMPGELGGFKLAGELRNITPEKPVVYMSGYTGFTTDEMGAVTAPLIKKPATRKEIAEVLHKTLGQDPS